jgi:TonB-dependent starch-binding outer membrane protein SusC
MRKIKRVLCTLFMTFSLFTVFAQNTKTVTGVVQDENGQPLSGVSILEKNTNNGTVSKEDGSFSLKLKDAASKLEISLVGFASQTVSPKSTSPLLIKLNIKNQSQDEVIIVGFQRQTKKTSTAAISSLSGKDIANLPAASFDQMLQGRLGGLIVQNNTGEPGVAPNITVRGNTSISRDFDRFSAVSTPLVLIDGIQQPNVDYNPSLGTGTNFLTGINPNDILKIDVLKDAAATAIYGSRGANGVILVTTKRGKNGTPSVTLSAFAGFVERPTTNNLLIGAEERRQKMRIFQSYLEKTPADSLFLLREFNPILLTDSLNPELNNSTDWEGLFFRTGVIKSTTLGISGGSENQQYNVSLGYYDENGIVKGTGFKRYTGRFNFLQKVFNGKLEINPILYFSKSDRQRGSGRTNSALPFSNGDNYALPASYLSLDPEKANALLNVYNNPANDVNRDNTSNFSLNLNYQLTPRIRLSSANSYQNYNSNRNQFRSSVLNNNTGNSRLSVLSKSESLISATNVNFIINPFNKNHLLLLTGVVNIESNTSTDNTVIAERGSNDFVNDLSGFSQRNIRTFISKNEYGTVSFAAQASYNYKEKYLLGLSVRRDGSSTFGSQSKWANFPSISAGWLLSNEGFLKNNNFLTFLKLRGSWGIAGSDNVRNPYLQYNLYQSNQSGTYNGNNTIIPSYRSGAAQPNLTWEKATSLNGGIDIELKNGKFAVTADVYNRDNTDQLFSVRIPTTTGYELSTTNSSGVRNYGVDLSITASPLNRASKLQWSTTLTFNYNENRVISLPNGNRDVYSGSNVITVNKPINSFYLYQSAGIYATDNSVPQDRFTGQFLNFYNNFGGSTNWFHQSATALIDQDGDNLVDLFRNDAYNADKITVGNPNPKYTGGFINNFRYKNFTLNVLCTYLFKRDVLNIRLAERFNAGDLNSFQTLNTADISRYNTWLKKGDNATYPLVQVYEFLIFGRDGNYTPVEQTLWMDKGDFFRVKTVTLGYDFTNALLKKIKLNRCRVYAVADNLFLWKKSKEMADPENVDVYGRYIGNGYPIPRKITFGLDVTF